MPAHFILIHAENRKEEKCVQNIISIIRNICFYKGLNVLPQSHNSRLFISLLPNCLVVLAIDVTAFSVIRVFAKTVIPENPWLVYKQ